VVAQSIDDLLTAHNWRDDANTQHAARTLLELPRLLQVDTGASLGRACRTRARPEQLLTGQPSLATCTAPRRADRRTHTQLQAASIHRRLALGSIFRAARVLEQSPLAPMDGATFEALRGLYPPEAISPAVADPGLAYQVTAKGLCLALCALPRGSAAGLGGWTREHISTAATVSAHQFQAILQMLNVLLDWTLPYIAKLLVVALIGIQKPGEGRRGEGGVVPLPSHRFGPSVVLQAPEIWQRAGGRRLLYTPVNAA
jgi:hypothetical protein